jgi:hypothetical protein
MKKYYYMNLGGMFTTVKETTEKIENLPKYIKEITEEEYNNFINKDFDKIS